MEVNLERPWNQNRSELFSSRGKLSKSWFQCWYRFSWPVPFF